MALHMDHSSIIDSDMIVSAHLCGGYGESDGSYAIAYLFDVGGKPERDVVVYPDEASRDAAFAALGQAIREEEQIQGDMRP